MSHLYYKHNGVPQLLPEVLTRPSSTNFTAVSDNLSTGPSSSASVRRGVDRNKNQGTKRIPTLTAFGALPSNVSEDVVGTEELSIALENLMEFESSEGQEGQTNPPEPESKPQIDHNKTILRESKISSASETIVSLKPVSQSNSLGTSIETEIFSSSVGVVNPDGEKYLSSKTKIPGSVEIANDEKPPANNLEDIELAEHQEGSSVESSEAKVVRFLEEASTFNPETLKIGGSHEEKQEEGSTLGDNKFPCRYTQSGCPLILESGTRSEMDHHSQCNYREIRCLFRNCPAIRVPYNDFVLHMNTHDLYPTYSTNSTFSMVINANAFTEDTDYCPKWISAYAEHFFVMVRRFNRKGIWWVWTYIFTDDNEYDESKPKYTTKITLFRGNKCITGDFCVQPIHTPVKEIKGLVTNDKNILKVSGMKLKSGQMFTELNINIQVKPIVDYYNVDMDPDELAEQTPSSASIGSRDSKESSQVKINPDESGDQAPPSQPSQLLFSNILMYIRNSAMALTKRIHEVSSMTSSIIESTSAVMSSVAGDEEDDTNLYFVEPTDNEPTVDPASPADSIEVHITTQPLTPSESTFAEFGNVLSDLRAAWNNGLGDETGMESENWSTIIRPRSYSALDDEFNS